MSYIYKKKIYIFCKAEKLKMHVYVVWPAILKYILDIPLHPGIKKPKGN